MLRTTYLILKRGTERTFRVSLGPIKRVTTPTGRAIQTIRADTRTTQPTSLGDITVKSIKVTMQLHSKVLPGITPTRLRDRAPILTLVRKHSTWQGTMSTRLMHSSKVSSDSHGGTFRQAQYVPMSCPCFKTCSLMESHFNRFLLCCGTRKQEMFRSEATDHSASQVITLYCIRISVEWLRYGRTEVPVSACMLLGTKDSCSSAS